MSAGTGLTTAKAVVPAYLTWQDAADDMQQLLFDLVKTADYDFGVDVTEHPVEKGSDITDNVRVKTDEATLELVLTNEPIESNNWATLIQGPQPLSVPSPPPPVSAAPILEYDKWSNMITERALTTGAGGFIGGAAGGPIGSIVGAAAGGVLGALLFQPHATPVVQPIDTSQFASPVLPMVAQTFSFVDDEDFVAKAINVLRTLKDNAQLFDLIEPRLVISDVVIASMKVHRAQETGTGATITLQMKQIRFVDTVTVPAPTPIIPTAQPVANAGEQNPVPATPEQQVSAAVALAAMLSGKSPFGNFSLGPGVPAGP